MTRRAVDDRPLGIVHGTADRRLALRVLGDALGFGVAAVLTPQGPRDVRPDWSHVRGVVVVEGPSVQWSALELEAVRSLTASGTTVALARLSPRRIPPELHGLPTLALWGDERTRKDGLLLIVDIFGPGRAPEGEQRQGFVFISYRSTEQAWVATAVVPALAEEGFGFFDYRGTELLDDADVAPELARRVDRCAVLLVVASPDWSDSENTTAELQHARARNRPVVVLRRRSWPKWPTQHGPATATIVFNQNTRDGTQLGKAIRRAVTSG